MGCVCIVSHKDAFSQALRCSSGSERQWAEYFTPAEYLIPPVGARQSCSNVDVNLKTKDRKKEGNEKFNEHVGIWQEGHSETPAVSSHHASQTHFSSSPLAFGAKDIGTNCL